jgi:hypothetical protein
MNYPVHQKVLRCEFNEPKIAATALNNYIKHTPKEYKRKYESAVHSKIRSILSTKSSTPAEPIYRNKKLSMKQELKLPKVGYCVKNLKAPIMMTINNNIKKQIKNSDYNKTETKEEGTISLLDYSNSSCDDSGAADESDSKIEDIICNSPAIKLAMKRDQTIYKKAQIETFKLLNDDDFEDDDIKKQAEILEAKKEINELKFGKPKKKYSILNTLHKEQTNKLKKNNTEYRELKDPAVQVKLKRIINTKEHTIFSRLYVLNNNPVFTLNGMTSYPFILNDTNMLANVYNVNLYKLRLMNDKISKRNMIY